MRYLAIVLGSLVVTLAATQVSAAPMCVPAKRGPASDYKCVIRTGYGMAVGHGSTKLKAKEEARLQCGMGLINGYTAARQNIPDDKIDDLALACVNLECE
jgi:hypothetical protein